jgi:hypothetical protein
LHDRVTENADNQFGADNIFAELYFSPSFSNDLSYYSQNDWDWLGEEFKSSDWNTELVTNGAKLNGKWTVKVCDWESSGLGFIDEIRLIFSDSLESILDQEPLRSSAESLSFYCQDVSVDSDPDLFFADGQTDWYDDHVTYQVFEDDFQGVFGEFFYRTPLSLLDPLTNEYVRRRRLQQMDYPIETQMNLLHEKLRYFDDTMNLTPYIELSSISSNNFDDQGSYVNWSGAFLNGVDDYVTIKNSPISGPAFFGVMVAPDCDDCLIFTIPMTVTDYWGKVYGYDSQDGYKRHLPQDSENRNAEVIAYKKGTSIRMLLRIEGEDDIVAEVTTAFPSGKWVYVAYEVALDTSSTNLGPVYTVPK